MPESSTATAFAFGLMLSLGRSLPKAGDTRRVVASNGGEACGRHSGLTAQSILLPTGSIIAAWGDTRFPTRR